jgi:transposase-like protein
MTRLSEEAKKSIVEKALTRKGKGLAEIASLHNIGYSTLHKWIFKYKNSIPDARSDNKSLGNTQFKRSDQLRHLLATATLDETALGAYCREHGLYSFQMQQWKNEFMSDDKNQKKQETHAELKALRAENKLLKKDLLRKDRALAETTALLVLKKKADLLFGVLEDD